tara:strand:- start:12131 stop:12868 length:738 start_codon:yes stop_codon:yes gene_type:complete
MMKTIDITELDPSNLNWLRAGKKSKEAELQKGRVYLKPGQQAPENVQVQTGPRGGQFYDEAPSQSTADETDPITIQPEGSISPENQALIDDLKEIGQINPIDPDEMIIDNVKVGPIKVWNDRVNLTGLTSLDPRSGAGSKALKRITDLADKHGVTLEDAAVPFRGADGEMIPKDKLRAFYLRHGYQFSDPNDPDRMVRFPQPTGPIRINIGGDDSWTSVPRDQEYGEDEEDEGYNPFAGTNVSIR